MAAFIDLVVGVIWGSVSGYVGGKVDEYMMRIADILTSLPYLLVVILLLVIMPKSLWTIIFAMTITGWINMARIVRGQVMHLMIWLQAHILHSLIASLVLGQFLPY